MNCIVKLDGLKSKKEWNKKYGKIIGMYIRNKYRYPMEIIGYSLSKKKITAKIKADNAQFLFDLDNYLKYYNQSNDKYTIKYIKGKGLGLISNKKFNIGDIILEDKPVFSFELNKKDWDAFSDNDTITKRFKFIKTFFNDFYNLGMDTQKLFISLYYKTNKKYINMNTLINIFLTNCFINPVPRMKVMSYSNPEDCPTPFSVYAIISRINHSCLANAIKLPNTGQSNNTSCIIATNKINIGDEITINYFGDSLNKDFSERREELRTWV